MGTKITAELMSVTYDRDDNATAAYATTIPLDIPIGRAWGIVDGMTYTVPEFLEYPSCVTMDIAQYRYCFSVSCRDNPPQYLDYEIPEDTSE